MFFSLTSFILLFISLRVELVVSLTPNFDLPTVEFWPALVRDATFAEDYDSLNYAHDYDYQEAQDFDAFSYAKANDKQFYNNQQQNYPNPIIGEHKNFAHVIPNDSKEEIYVFVDKGCARYMSMDEFERTHAMPGDINSNGQHFPGNRRQQRISNNFDNGRKRSAQNTYDDDRQQFHNNDWSNDQQQDFSKHGNKNERNFQKRDNCLEKSGSHIRPAPKRHENFGQYDYNVERQSNFNDDHAGALKKNCPNGNGLPKNNCDQKFYRRCQQEDQKDYNDCTARQSEVKAVTKNVATVEQKTVKETKSVEGSEVSVAITGSTPDSNRKKQLSDRPGRPRVRPDGSRSRGDDREPSKKNPAHDSAKNHSEMKDSEEKSTQNSNKENQLPARPGRPGLDIESDSRRIRGDDREPSTKNLAHDSAKNKSEIKNPEEKFDDEVNQSIDDEEIEAKKKQSDEVGARRQKISPQEEIPLTDSPIMYIKPIPAKQANKKRRRTTPSPNTNSKVSMATPTSLSNEKLQPKPRAFSTKVDANQPAKNNNSIQKPLVRKPSQNRPEENAKTEDDATIDEVNRIAQIINTELNKAFETEKNAFEDEEEHDSPNSEIDQNMDDANDLSSSEDRLYTYVTKLDGTAPKLNNHKKHKYMEPIAFETLIKERKTNRKRPSQKSNKHNISKLKRSPKTRRLRSQSPDTTITTTPSSMTTTTDMTEMRFPNNQQNLNTKPNNRNFQLIPAERFRTLPNDKQMFVQPESQDLQQNVDKKLDDDTTEDTNQQQPNEKSMHKAQRDSQVLGSRRSFNGDDNDDPSVCQHPNLPDDWQNDDEDYFDQLPRLTNDLGPLSDRSIELPSAEHLNSPHKCNNPNDAACDGDQPVDKIIGKVTPAPRRHADDELITK